MDKQLIQKLKLTFDDIMHTTENDVEFWYARELQPILGYSNWQNFENVIEKARISCRTSENIENDHFIDVSKMVTSGVADRPIKDVMLTRYACYLVAQNGDPRKDEIAFAQSYFAVQTRKAEIIEKRLKELNRLQLREQLRTSEKRLSQNIYERGVRADEKNLVKPKE